MKQSRRQCISAIARGRDCRASLAMTGGLIICHEYQIKAFFIVLLWFIIIVISAFKTDFSTCSAYSKKKLFLTSVHW
jgi:hypothetical protein